MDYTYFSAPQQPYHHFMGMASNHFAHSGVDPETIRSVVRRRDNAPHSAQGQTWLTNLTGQPGAS